MERARRIRLIRNIYKKALLATQCRHHSLGWIDSNLNFIKLPPRNPEVKGAGGPYDFAESHSQYFDNYSEWRDTEDSDNWIKVSNATYYFSNGREFDNDVKLIMAKIYINCVMLSGGMHNPDDYMSMYNADMSLTKTQIYDFFDEVMKINEEGQKLYDIFYNILMNVDLDEESLELIKI